MSDPLDTQQQAAVKAKGRACLVLAGPGSGKTTVIVHRVRNLISEQNVPAKQILVITYTRAAAAEMQSRFETLCPGETGHVRFLTFHAFCYHFLHREGRNFHILSEQEKRTMYKRVQAGLPAAERPAMELFFSELSKKNNVGPGDMNRSFQPSTMSAQTFHTLYTRWEEERTACGGMDYDDLPNEVWKYLSLHPNRLQLWQEEISHLLVDEAQDMNPMQLALAKRLTDGSGHLFLVGDDDQSIYGFRGSDSKILLSFQSIWPQGTILRLERNYRCAKSIIEAAGHLISHNQNRFDKKPEAVRKDPGRILAFTYEDEEEEAENCAAYLKTCARRPKQTAVLYRSRYQARYLLDLCIREEIPVCLREPLPANAGQGVAEDLMAYLMLASGCGTSQDVIRILNRPNRGLLREHVPKDPFSFEEWEYLARGNPGQVEQIRRLKRILQQASVMTPYAALRYLWQATGYGGWAASVERNGVEDALEQVWQFAKSAGSQAGPQALFRFSTEYRTLQRQIGEKNQNSASGQNRPKPGEIFFSTFHGSKGMEFDTVVILDANEGYTPCGREPDVRELEEERRLFYVALTRAKDRVRILSAKKHRGKITPVSRFLSEMKR